ncbi:hypothetical protein BsWGS_24962 [Bradybaena similaris]
MSQVTKSVSLLLVGKEGNGKSSTGNSILGDRKHFNPTSSSSSAGLKIKQASATVGNDREIIVTEIAGLEYPGLDYTGNFEKTLKKIEETIQENKKGFNAIIFVLKYGTPFAKEEKDALVMIKSIFGFNVLKEFGVIVMTCGDSFEFVVEEEEDKQTFEEWCQAQTGDVKTLFEECAYRCVLFNNRAKDAHKMKEQQDKLFSLVELIPHPYTLYDYRKALKGQTEILVQTKLPQLEIEKNKTMGEVWKDLSNIDQELSVSSCNIVELSTALNNVKQNILHLKEYLQVEDQETGVLKHLFYDISIAEMRLEIAEERLQVVSPSGTWLIVSKDGWNGYDFCLQNITETVSIRKCTLDGDGKFSSSSVSEKDVSSCGIDLFEICKTTPESHQVTETMSLSNKLSCAEKVIEVFGKTSQPTGRAQKEEAQGHSRQVEVAQGQGHGTQVEVVQAQGHGTQVEIAQAQGHGTRVDVAQAQGHGTQVEVAQAQGHGTQVKVAQAQGHGTQVEVAQAQGHGTRVEIAQAQGHGRQIEVAQAQGHGTQVEVAQAQGHGTRVEIAQAQGHGTQIEVAQAQGHGTQVEVAQAQGHGTQVEVAQAQGHDTQIEVAQAQGHGTQIEVAQAQGHGTQIEVAQAQGHGTQVEVAQAQGHGTRVEMAQAQDNGTRLEAAQTQGHGTQVEVAQAQGHGTQVEVAQAQCHGTKVEVAQAQCHGTQVEVAQAQCHGTKVEVAQAQGHGTQVEVVQAQGHETQLHDISQTSVVFDYDKHDDDFETTNITFEAISTILKQYNSTNALCVISNYKHKLTKQEIEAVIKKIKETYDTNRVKNQSILILTCDNDNLEVEKDQMFKVWCQEKTGSNKRLLDLCGERCVLLNPWTEDIRTFASQKIRLLMYVADLDTRNASKYDEIDINNALKVIIKSANPEPGSWSSWASSWARKSWYFLPKS